MGVNMKRVVQTSLAIVFMLAATAIQAGSKVSPKSVTGAVTVDVTQAKALFEKGTPFVDVRNTKDWNAGRIPGAAHLDIESAYSEAALAKIANKNQELVLYCNGASCMRSSDASRKAVGWGFTGVRYFRDGFPAWKSAGYPVE